jgi:para-aminobenzoate synthetase / 4-amino-4-deoxychorismate lyase
MDTLINANEVLLKENHEWLHFADPYRVIQADALAQVVPALREIEDLIQSKGWHAAGFLSYEAAPAFDKAYITKENFRPEWSRWSSGEAYRGQRLRSTEVGFPYLWFGLYAAPRVSTLPEPASAQPALTWLPTVDRDMYNDAIAQIKDRIAEGRTYQVNYTMRLRTDFNTDAWNFFLRLAQTQNNHAAYINTGRYVICSASPEIFFQLEGKTITCRPMKGTTQRGRTTLEDAEQAQALKDSEKNRAENVMIVDMVRNDLGRIARVGSVQVPELFTVEKYPTLWQMTSTVTAKTDASLTEIFSALFPCASITGAPRVSTMKIIAELETTPRRIYTGSIGHVAPSRKATFNVAIRTALIDRTTQTAEYGVGGGIVWDSTSTDEYAEALLKARVLTEQTPTFALLETMLWTPAAGFFLCEKHIARLLDSASYFDFPISSEPYWSRSAPRRALGATRPTLPKEIIENYLHETSSQFNSPQRVRVLLDKNGRLNFESKSFQPSEDHLPIKVCLAKGPIDSGDVFLYHKTTHREVFDSARKGFPEYDDVLLYNEKGELTEFTIGNLVVEMDGALFTPPISCGLLPGVFRAHLLETGQVKERVIRVAELKDCTKIFLVNSVRKWQRVVLEWKGLSSSRR